MRVPTLYVQSCGEEERGKRKKKKKEKRKKKKEKRKKKKEKRKSKRGRGESIQCYVTSLLFSFIYLFMQCYRYFPPTVKGVMYMKYLHEGE